MPISVACEFPNDNPELHAGARWVCRRERGPSRAVVCAEHLGAVAVRLPLPPHRRPLDGPLEIDLERIVLLHRVEDVPPPPDFVFTPFTSSRPLPVARCEPVDARPPARRVARSCGVDAAPCIALEPTPEAMLPVSPSLQPEPSAACVEEQQAPARRRRSQTPRKLALQPLGERDEVARAIAELESAFEEQRQAPHLAVGA